MRLQTARSPGERPAQAKKPLRNAPNLRIDSTANPKHTRNRFKQTIPKGKLITQFEPPDLANHVHGDHLISQLKFSAEQWNTLVNFQSAL